MNRRRASRWMSLTLLSLASGCAPAMTTMKMPNPALSPNAIEATQTYEVPPYREDHRYEVTLGRWSASGIEVRIHLVNVEDCAQPSTYSFELVDDRGRRYPFQQTGAVKATAAAGHLGATVSDVMVAGTFAAPIEASTRYVVVEVRPRNERACTGLDFRWDFQA
jgi:hypothetical protein